MFICFFFVFDIHLISNDFMCTYLYSSHRGVLEEILSVIAMVVGTMPLGEMKYLCCLCAISKKCGVRHSTRNVWNSDRKILSSIFNRYMSETWGLKADSKIFFDLTNRDSHINENRTSGMYCWLMKNKEEPSNNAEDRF